MGLSGVAVVTPVIVAMSPAPLPCEVVTPASKPAGLIEAMLRVFTVM